MKKRSWILVLVLIAAFLLASISLASAQPDLRGAIACNLDITFNDYSDGTYWLGAVTGDRCDIAGTIKFFAVHEEYDCPPGNTMHSTMIS